VDISGDAAPTATATHATDTIAAPPPPPPPPPPRDDASADSKGGGGSLGIFELLLTLGIASLRWRAKRSLSVPLCALCVVLALPAQAQDVAGWYTGVRIGRMEADASAAQLQRDLARYGHDVQVTMDASDSGWSALVGHRFNQYFALEAAYSDLGEVTAHLEGDVPSLTQFAADLPRVHPYSIDGYSLSAIAGLPIRKAMLFGRAGWMSWQSNQEAVIGSGMHVAIRDDGIDAFWGLGAQYAFAQRWTVRAEWERYKTRRNDLEFTSVSLTFRF
jgi:OOP family OmpA-OmpF porin